MLIELSEVSIEVQFHASTLGSAPTIILSHPHPVYGGTMTNKVIDQIYRRSVERDWSVLRYNMRGFGKSTGSFNEGVGEEKDLHELIQWTMKQPGIDPDRLWLIGYSFGSWLTAKVASKMHKTCVLIAPPVSMYPFPALDFNQPKIIFSAEKDELIPFEKVKVYADSISEPKHHVSIPEADHYFIGTTAQLIREVFKELDGLK